MFCGQAGSNMISENAINNNSLVCKLKFKKFSMLFTGDIEEIADKPQYAIIGVGKNNKFGHPADVTIQNLRERKIKIYRTDEMGEVVLKTNGKGLKFIPFIK